MAPVAAGRRRDPAFGVDPANKGSIRKAALPFMGFGT
jgi:hypothetical protein